MRASGSIPPGVLAPNPAFPTGATVIRALAVARWLTWLWMVGVVIVASNRSVDEPLLDDPSGPGTAFRHPVVAWLCVLALLAVCISATVLVRSAPERLISARFASVEVALALAITVADGWVFDPGHVFETSQSLATQYPLIAIATTGLALGPWIAAALGSLFGPAEWAAVELNDFSDWSARHVFSLVASSLFLAAAGALFGWLGRLLRSVERRIADQRARDEVAIVLHDTVLQTLALVEQRSSDTDPDLAVAARRADRELRRFLFGSPVSAAGDLRGRVRDAVERATRGHDIVPTVNIIDLDCTVSTGAQEAVAGAIGEAVTNAIKHAGATSIVVFVETDDDGQLFASVRDDGCGFERSSFVPGQGIVGSIRGRMAAVGGRSEIVSSPGDGTEVRVWTT